MKAWRNTREAGDCLRRAVSSPSLVIQVVPIRSCTPLLHAQRFFLLCTHCDEILIDVIPAIIRQARLDVSRAHGRSGGATQTGRRVTAHH